MLEKDDTGAALLMLGKLILFIGMFVLLYAGNKRGRGWYTLSEPLYKKPYLCRWKWLMLAAFIFTALENNWMNMNDDGEIDSISYVSLMVLAEIPAYTLMLATLVKRAEVLKFRQWIFTIFITLTAYKAFFYQLRLKALVRSATRYLFPVTRKRVYRL